MDKATFYKDGNDELYAGEAVSSCIVDARGYRVFVLMKFERGLEFLKPVARMPQALALRQEAD